MMECSICVILSVTTFLIISASASSEGCSLRMEDGQQHTSVMLNTADQMYNITVSGVSDCNVTVLVVGGGGGYVGSQTY